MKMLYDNFELQECAEFIDENFNTCIESVFDDGDKENAINVFWTIYGHLPEGGVSALIDFQDEEIAREHLDFFNGLLNKGE